MLLAAAVQATPVVIHDPDGNVTEIHGLELNGEFFDVEFLFGKGIEVFGEVIFEFKDQNDALAAAATVAVVLNSESTLVITVGPPGFEQPLFNIPWQVQSSNVRVARGEVFASEWTAGIPSTGSLPTGDAIDYSGLTDSHSWAKFTEAGGPPAGNQPPTADPGGPYSGTASVAIIFDGMGSSDTEGSIVTYDWTFGDSGFGSGATPSHTYLADGVYNVTLTVTDDADATDSMATTATIDAVNLSPVGDAGGPYTAVAGAAVSFDGSGSVDPEGSISLYDWDFDDGNVGSGVAPSHTYIDDGIYNVSLTVTDAEGLTHSDDTSATIGSTDQTLQVILDPDNPSTVIRIENLPITLTSGETVVYDVGFRNERSDSVYAESADDFPFTDPLTKEADAFLAIDAINAVLNGNAPVPDSTGVPSENVFYIGLEWESIFLLTVGGEFTAAEWQVCLEPNCIVGVATHRATDVNTYADLVMSDPAANQSPLADAGGPYVAEVNVAVSFDGSGSSDPDGIIETYEWDFGDESPVGSGATPSHTYDTAGTYNILLTVTDNAGARDSHPTTAGIDSTNQPPLADANGPYNGETDEPITFDGTGSSDPNGDFLTYDWDFGDDSVATGVTSRHLYSADGAYPVTLTVTDDNGAITSDSTSATIGGSDQAPVADPGGPYTGTGGVIIIFDGTGSAPGASTPQGETTVVCGADFETATPCGVGDTNAAGILSLDVDGTLYDVEFKFDFGMDLFELPFIFNTDPEALAAAVAVSDALDTVSEVVTVDQQNFFGIPFGIETGVGINPRPLLAVRSADYLGAEWQTDVTSNEVSGASSYAVFTAEADTVAEIVSYDWDFGDGFTESGPNPQHYYIHSGTYPVTLTVVDNNAASDLGSTTATIGGGNLPPTANAGGPYSGDAGVPVTFDASFSSDPNDSIVSYTWDFGDGLSGSGEIVDHVYESAGVKFVILTVTDSKDVASSDDTVAIIGLGAQPPTADAGGPYGGVINVAVNFDGTDSLDTDGKIETYEWDFGDGSPVGSGATASHTYSTSGAQYVTLTVTDDDGLTDTDDGLALVGTTGLPPVADSGGPYFGKIDAAVSFDGSNSSHPSGSIVAYDWAFGDGNIGSGATPSHTYTTDGAFFVILTVTDDAGVIDSGGTAAVIGSIADLSVDSIDASPIPLSVDGQLTYTITVSNSGPSDELAAAVNIVISPNAVFDSATATQGTCSDVTGTIDCDLGAMLNGGDVTITVIVTAPPEPSSLPIEVTISGQAVDPNGANNVSGFQVDAIASVKLRTKTKKGLGAFGVIELLLFVLAVAALRIRRIRRTSIVALLSTGFLCGLMLGSPTISHAQDSGWYIGAGAGATDVDSDTSNFAPAMAALGHIVSDVNIDDSSEGWKLFGGYNVNEYFATELAYVDLGEVTANFDGLSNNVPQMMVDAAGLLPVLGDGFSIAALGRYPFGERWAIFAKVGAYFWESDVAVTEGTSASANPKVDGTDFAYGVGGDLYFGSRFGVRLEWERYALDPNDVDLVSASLMWQF